MFRYDIEILRAIFGRKKLVEECLREKAGRAHGRAPSTGCAGSGQRLTR
jgi:hypothetical protein